MLLTLKQPSQSAFPSPPHVQRSPQRIPTSNISPPHTTNGALPPLPDPRSADRMSAQHRGLPPPLALTLQDRERAPAPGPPAPLNQPMGNLPAPPNQWQGADESMRNWLMAKAEEDKRKQEEEKTRQETLRLEQRRIEQSMLRESLQGGVPPPMVPIVFAGMGGNNLSNTSLEWAQHYMAQITLQQQQHQQQQQLQPPHSAQLPPSQQTSPGLSRDRSITGPQPNPYAAQPSPAAMQYGMLGRPGNPGPTPTSNPRSGGLARLNTGEPQSTTAEQSSPSIYFHHWVPPNNQKEQPASGNKSQHSSPYQQSAPSHLRSDYGHSPKKRKTTASSHASTAKSPELSPQISAENSAHRRAHSNQRSDASSRGAHEAFDGSRPESRHGARNTSDAENGSQRQGSPPHDSHRTRDSAGPERKDARSGTPKREAEGPP